MTLGKYIHTLQLLHRQTKLAFPFDPEISYSSYCSNKSFSLWDGKQKKKLLFGSSRQSWGALVDMSCTSPGGLYPG